LAALLLGVSGVPAAVAAPFGAQECAGPIAQYVAEAAGRFGIPQSWIYAVMRVESGGNPRAVSPKGATGLMQLMPETWAYLRVRYALGNDIYDVHDNIFAGAAYLREMYDRYGSPGFLAAYNAGPGRYEAYLANRRALPAETIAYMRKLAPVVGEVVPDRMRVSAPDPLAWTRSAVFTVRSASGSKERVAVPRTDAAIPSTAGNGTEAGSIDRKPNSLFVPLSGKTP
jgi:hypothetical protein